MEMNDILASVMAEIMSDAEKQFKAALTSKNLVFTGDLKDSFERHIVQHGAKIAGEITFKQYGRFKDMKRLRYLQHMPPTDAMEFFIEKTGIDRFAYVPGYNNKSPHSISDIMRIAWAISNSKKRAIDVKRGYRGTWYNESKMLMINNAKKQLRWRASEFISWQIKQQFEGKS
jgi:hypothetical protein